jgi:hypothetical protein
LPCTQTAPDVTIFYDRIERLEMRPISGGATVSQILGYAMAHEIGHVLLGSTEHSADGIMRGPWKQPEFERRAKGWLQFTTQQSAAMRESAFRQASLQQSAGTNSETETSALSRRTDFILTYPRRPDR